MSNLSPERPIVYQLTLGIHSDWLASHFPEFILRTTKDTNAGICRKTDVSCPEIRGGIVIQQGSRAGMRLPGTLNCFCRSCADCPSPHPLSLTGVI